VKLTFHKNSKDEFHCPITYKVFNENSHIVAIAKTGNVFSGEAVEQLNLKSNFFKDLLNDEPFVKKDIITIQDPSNLTKFNITNFFYLKENLKWESDSSLARKDPNFYLNSISSEAKSALEELKTSYVAPTTSTSSSNYVLSGSLAKADSVNAASYSTGRVAASFTSTVMEICTRQEPAIIDENEIRWSRVRKLGKKGYVCLATNLGRLNIELFCDQVPKTCENFLKHCENKYYKDTTFHRMIPKFMVHFLKKVQTNFFQNNETSYRTFISI
jgi:peptidyl-prolyl cis-trans isomerase-like protein 2